MCSGTEEQVVEGCPRWDLEVSLGGSLEEGPVSKVRQSP